MWEPFEVDGGLRSERRGTEREQETSDDDDSSSPSLNCVQKAQRMAETTAASKGQELSSESHSRVSICTVTASHIALHKDISARHSTLPTMCARCKPLFQGTPLPICQAQIPERQFWMVNWERDPAKELAKAQRSNSSAGRRRCSGMERLSQNLKKCLRPVL